MKTLEDYLALPYTKTIQWNSEDELYVARVKEIDGCTGHGQTEAEALAMLQDNLAEWISFCIEAGEPVPLPQSQESLPSGKWLQRVPRSLHAALARAAEEDNVSLNQFVMSILSKEVGHRTAQSDVISTVDASAPPMANPWAILAHTRTSNWHVEAHQVNAGVEDVFVKRLLGALPKEHQSGLIGKEHGENKETIWN